MTEALQQGPRTYRRAVGLCLLNTRDDESLPAQRVLHGTLSHAAQKSHTGSSQGESNTCAGEDGPRLSRISRVARRR